MRILILLLALTACGDDLDVVPESTPTHHIRMPLNPVTDSPAKLEAAQELIRTAWGDRLGVELPPIPTVVWFDYADGTEPPCLIYQANQSLGRCLIGLYQYSGHDDEVHILDEGLSQATFAYTPLAHEMLHWALRHARGGANAAHDDWMWSQVVEVDSELIEAGL